MKTKNFAIIVGILTFLIIVFLRDNIQKDKLVVIINDNGFVPDKVVVQKGQTVVWINKGDRLHWPASNSHPTHNLYPEVGGCIGSKFDACRGLKNDETFSFKFDRIGEWPVHDHLFPGLVMVVDVVNKKDVKSLKIKGVELPSYADFRNLSYGNQLDLVKSMAEKDPGFAWDYIKEAFVVNGQVIGNAHEFSHIIGNKSYEKSGFDGMVICDATFAFGCFHGVSEAMLLKEGVGSVKSIEKGCYERFPENGSLDYTGCIHGTGHGLFTWEGGDMKKALKDCDLISEKYRQYCYDGVFMENSGIPENDIIDSRDPWKFCNDLPKKYHNNCARYQSKVFAERNSMAVAGKYCSVGPYDSIVETCFESLGYYVAQKAFGKPQAIKEMCGKMPYKNGIEICTVGASVETVFQHFDGYKKNSSELCLGLSQTMKDICLGRTTSMMN